MNINSPFEQWRLKYMQGKAASGEIMELLALAFEEGRAVSKPWVSLTDDEIVKIVRETGWGQSHLDWTEIIEFTRFTEAKLKEKNT